MNIKIIPKSNEFLEGKKNWRFFKVIYFTIGSIGGGLTYSLINSWYYTNCPITDLPWVEAKLVCTKFFAWEELIGFTMFFLLMLRILFPLIEKLILYIIIDKKDTK